ncbi:MULTISPECIES: LLM class flavin-dependent oxidoreductase [Glutamicibacter]|uniref:LLM class flavin-dependent oxidoreductase n=1 Tax=Glutamicibacter TaxID=1742989 RepID=UPI0015C5255B|nr:LLM class flavin-dependent oxidoreductase [Glutamicibacter halophytocola]NQD42636.1 LLM class flavin-dependent oxidoreductase [Glutamicibacter halophytocola]
MSTQHQLRFGVFFQGVNSSTIWRSEASGSQTDFSSFRQIAQTAERGLFSAFFLGEGLRLREHLGEIHELDVAGRPDAQTMLAALAAVTSKIGLVATQNTTYNDPADLARRLSSLDLISEGRAAWNIVTTHNAWTGANFRRGGYLEHHERYSHAEDFVRTVRQIWEGAPVHHRGNHYNVDYTGTVPVSAQHRPVLFQAGDSAEGRDFAARQTDVIFSAHVGLEDALEFRRDINARAATVGRAENSVKIMPGAEFIVAETPEAAEEKHHWVREHQIGPQQALAYLEQFWGTRLESVDPYGPLPEFEPVVVRSSVTRGSGFQGAKSLELAATWRAEAKEKGQNIIEFVRSRSHRADHTFTGSYDQIASRLARYAELGAVDGFNITPWLIPTGLDDIVNHLVPRLQERGIYPESYAGTLRENLGLSIDETHEQRAQQPALAEQEVS